MSFTSEPDSWRTPPSWVNTAGEVGVCELKDDDSYKSVKTSVIQRQLDQAVM